MSFAEPIRAHCTVKAYYETIDAEPNSGLPAILRWRNRTYRVRRVLDYWVLQNKWWEKEEKRIYLLLETVSVARGQLGPEGESQTMEVYHVGCDWKLARLVD